MLSNNNEDEFIAYLDSRRGKIFSHTGGWKPGKGVFTHGYSILDELIGEKSYFQIIILNATGKLVNKPLADWIESVCGCLSWPDSRIWCNQIGALAGGARTSAVAATTMGCLASDSRVYGPYTIIEGARFIQGALRQYKAGHSAADIVKEVTAANRGKPRITGYIRPIAKGDERIEVMERVTKKLGFEPGDHLKLAYQIENVLLEQFDEGMNINGYVSAFLSDQEFTADEIYHMYTTAVASGVTACYLDTLTEPSESFLPLQCEDIDYTGKGSRSVPEKQ